MSLEACLPTDLRTQSPTITKIAAGLSGAGVYRVVVGDASYVLKISGDEESLAEWQRKCHVQQLAAAAGVAPRVVHTDEARRAVISAFVADQGFPPYYGNPRTHAAALAQLGETLRRVHAIALPADATVRDPRQLLAGLRDRLAGEAILPAFAREVIARVLAEAVPDAGRPDVLSHNDVNPTNLVFDGERVLLLDWDMAGGNDVYYDLAAIAVFLRMDDATCLGLLSAHDGAPVTALPARFAYDRRLVAALCGVLFLHLSREAGRARVGDSLEATIALADLYPKLRAGEVNLATADGRWQMGAALVKESARL